jgi:hypothetical protein
MQLTVLLVLLSCSLLAFPQAIKATVEKPPETSAKDGVQSGASVNVVADCGAVGNGVTDDWGAIQTCITGHPGKAIFFPKMRNVPCTSGAGGGCIGSVDYYVSKTLKLSGNSQALIGEGPSRWPEARCKSSFREI